MNRRLAVPLAVRGVVRREQNSYYRRILRGDEDHEDMDILRRLAENGDRIDALIKDLEDDPEVVDSPEMSTELDYIKASIQLGLLEITGELEEIPYSDDLLEEAAA